MKAAIRKILSAGQTSLEVESDVVGVHITRVVVSGLYLDGGDPPLVWFLSGTLPQIFALKDGNVRFMPATAKGDLLVVEIAP